MSGSFGNSDATGPGSTQWAGFTFNPSPIVLNGQQVAGPDLQFSDPVAVSQVDQASQAYNFTNNLINNAYAFVGNADTSVQDFNQPLFNDIYSGETTWGNSLTASISTEANALATASKAVAKGSAGSGGGGILGFLTSLF